MWMDSSLHRSFESWEECESFYCYTMWRSLGNLTCLWCWLSRCPNWSRLHIYLLECHHTIATATISIINSNQYSITFTIIFGNVSSTCTCVYGSPNPSLHNSFWNCLANLNQTIIGSWMLIGDFNETLLPRPTRRYISPL
jgi:hypothetical protein